MPAPSHPPFKVADLLDTFSGPWGSDAQKNAPLRVVECDWRCAAARHSLRRERRQLVHYRR